MGQFVGPIASVSGITATTTVRISNIQNKNTECMYDSGWFAANITGNSGTSPDWTIQVQGELGGVFQGIATASSITATGGVTFGFDYTSNSVVNQIAKGLIRPSRVVFTLAGGTASGAGFIGTVHAALYNPY